MNRLSVWGKGEKIARRGKGKGEPPFPQTCSLQQCRRILGGRNLVRVRDIVVAVIFDFNYDSGRLGKLRGKRKRLYRGLQTCKEPVHRLCERASMGLSYVTGSHGSWGF